MLFAAGPAAAQTPATPASRAEENAQAQAEKAKETHPPRLNWLQQRFLAIEERGGFGIPAKGLWFAFGDIKSGSGIALGPTYTHIWGNGTLVQAKAAYSLRNFKMGQVFVQAPPLAQGRLTINGRGRWQDAPELAVYPLGMSEKIRADYAETMTEFSGQAVFRPVWFVALGGGSGIENYETDGADSRRSSVEELFTPASMPGLLADPNYIHSFVSAGIDSTKARSGTLLRATLHDYRQQNDGPFSFQRADYVARQQLPILHGNWVIDLSARASTTNADAFNEVPFFLMPDLGGGSDLRGYGNYRFRDQHSLMATAELRWYVQEYVDMAIFYDAGKVARRTSDLDFDGMKSDVGIGLRFVSPRSTVLRIELARGSEGMRFIFGFGAHIK
jgi:hypothetical protein